METKHIQLHDLANVLNLIDAASQKGMFTGDQLSTIGAMRDRFMSELKEQAPAEDNVATIEDPDTAVVQ
ncbi:MAG TPA: hypothetical protein DCL39_17995 [Alteromonas macleodii]|nr:hypothetical protein [Alteromonas macleodii]|tara:strand:- start:1554 stop:1760 length:207 start_codon:yes stop_codon:yes gene_type:complete